MKKALKRLLLRWMEHGQHLVPEMAGLMYCILGLLATRDLGWQHVEKQMASRFR